MYAKRIIPCLDVKNGRVVKGMSFVNLVDAGDPVESAMQYDKQGADELVAHCHCSAGFPLPRLPQRYERSFPDFPDPAGCPARSRAEL